MNIRLFTGEVCKGKVALVLEPHNSVSAEFLPDLLVSPSSGAWMRGAVKGCEGGPCGSPVRERSCSSSWEGGGNGLFCRITQLSHRHPLSVPVLLHQGPNHAADSSTECELQRVGDRD